LKLFGYTGATADRIIEELWQDAVDADHMLLINKTVREPLTVLMSTLCAVFDLNIQDDNIVIDIKNRFWAVMWAFVCVDVAVRSAVLNICDR